MPNIPSKDCEILVTDGHVVGHRFRYVTQHFFKRTCVAYVAASALCVFAVSGGIPGGIALPAWLVAGLTANPENYVAKPKPVEPPPAPVVAAPVDTPSPQPQPQAPAAEQPQNQDIQPGQSVAHPVPLPAAPAPEHHGIPGEEPFNTSMFIFHTPESWASNPPSQHERILEYMRQFKKAESTYNKAHHITPAPAAEQPADAQ